MNTFLIVGLGNPGPKYNLTRHNAGFWILDALAQHYVADQLGEKFGGILARATDPKIGTLLFFKPLSFMNLSGRPVAAVAGFYKIPADGVIVIHDDIDLQEGVVRFREGGGGHGGHNGVRDITSALGTPNFSRIKVGVGRPAADSPMQVRDWVLAPLREQEVSQFVAGILPEVQDRFSQWATKKTKASG